MKIRDPRLWPDEAKKRVAKFIQKQSATTSAYVDSPCWLWTGWKDRNGYGRFSIPHPSGDGKKRVHIMSHRLVYMLSYGPIDEDLVLDHLCLNRSCVRPSHLEMVTQEENIRRRDTQK